MGCNLRAFILVDQIFDFGYNNSMKLDTNEILQWAGAVFIVAGHSLNAVGPEACPYNILTFFIGTILFLIWTVRVANKPQMFVNLVSVLIGLSGLVKAFG
jgi:hypothetical protein